LWSKRVKLLKLIKSDLITHVQKELRTAGKVCVDDGRLAFLSFPLCYHLPSCAIFNGVQEAVIAKKQQEGNEQ